MYILTIETATKNCSVALFRNGKMLAYKEQDGNYSHAEKLHVFIDEVLKDAGVKHAELNAIAVGEGPGSYTGLRIGLAAAKGFCYALNIPLIAINTLETMIVGVRENFDKNSSDNNTLFCPMIDARRMEVYTMIADADLHTLLTVQPMIVDENCAIKNLTEKGNKIIYFGDGAEKCIDTLSKFSNTEFFKIQEFAASSRFMGELALKKYEQKQFEDIAYFEPKYLKQFMATTPKKLL